MEVECEARSYLLRDLLQDDQESMPCSVAQSVNRIAFPSEPFEAANYAIKVRIQLDGFNLLIPLQVPQHNAVHTYSSMNAC